MCQECVKDGRMTQEELDARVAAGDRTVIPIDELTLPEFADYAAAAAATAIQGGMPMDEAWTRMADEIDQYFAWREHNDRPITDAEIRDVAKFLGPARAETVAAEKVREAAPWN